jgi:hypothetical protein
LTRQWHSQRDLLLEGGRAKLTNVAVGVVFRWQERKRTVRKSLAWGSEASSARAAARRPAASPSKLKTTESVKRNSFCTCSAVQAVPKVATALAKPDWDNATTSI